VSSSEITQLERWYERAIAVDGEARATVVAECARESASLARLLGRMLAQDVPDVRPAIRWSEDDDDVPRRIGGYDIHERLGSGGFGVVHRATQVEPICRTAAIKILRRVVDAEVIRRRYEVERVALASLNHPCIPRLIDAGVTEDGRPFLVMQHVPGVPITRHCAVYRLHVEARLRLMARVCDAISHAHGRGVLHRDIKRGNVLVVRHDGWDEPKVIDFGISKIVLGEVPAPSGAERTEAMGTYATMAPELLRGEKASEASDVYSLGVLLYELVSGRRPQRGSDELLPPSGVAGRPRWSGNENSNVVARLDAIVLRCLCREPEGRWGSVKELGEALRQFCLDDSSAESLAAQVDEGQRLAYAGEFARSEALLVEVVERAQASLGERHAVTLRARAMLAVTIQEQNRQEEAEPMLQDVLALCTEMFGAESVEALDAMNHLALCVMERGRLEESSVLHERALAGRRRVLGDDHTDTLLSLNNLVGLRYKQGRYAESVPMARQVVEMRTCISGPDSPDTMTCLSNLGSLLVKVGELEEAEACVRRSLVGLEAALGAAHPTVIISLGNLCNVLRLMKRYPESEAAGVMGLERGISEHGPENGYCTHVLRKVLQALDEWHAAEPSSGADARAAALRERAARLGVVVGNA
jgi:eukaryotic-like serine/threonine-protein kinase